MDDMIIGATLCVTVTTTFNVQSEKCLSMGT